MWPYQPNSDALFPPPALPVFAVELVLPVPWDGTVPFTVASSPRRSGDRRSLSAFGDGLGETFANRIFFEVGFGVALGVTFGFGVGIEDGFGFGVDDGVRFGVGEGNSISLFAVITAGFSSSGSSVGGFGSIG
jgi:hypothetical protein